MSALQTGYRADDLVPAPSALFVEDIQGTVVSCRLIPSNRIASQTVGSYLAFTQLIEQIRGVLISLLSYELQTPLCAIQTTVETLLEGDTIPAQAQRSMVQLSLSELNRITQLVESFLIYANKVWALTLDFAQFRPSRTAATYLKSMFATLPTEFEKGQIWTDLATARLQPFLTALSDGHSDRAELIWAHERDLLEQEWQQTLAIINHEVRSPFTTLKVCLETLENDGTTPLSARIALLSVAKDDLERLSSLSQDLEFLSRLASRQVHFQPEKVDLTATLKTTLASFLQQTAQESSVSIRIDNDVPAPLLWIDGDRLAEVLQRLLANACRFTTTAGDIRIRHQVFGLSGKAQDERSTLRIDVSDSGCGINAEHLECVFECFYQEEDYLRRSKGGMGLGLTICRYLVEGMGGRIWAESSGKDKGSCFCLVLPVRKELDMEERDRAVNAPTCSNG